LFSITNHIGASSILNALIFCPFLPILDLFLTTFFPNYFGRKALAQQQS
jgi:hypothetical protein